MRNKIFANYDEKFLKTTILIVDDEFDLLYEENGDNAIPVSKHRLSDLFFKGMTIQHDGKYYNPIMLDIDVELQDESVEHGVVIFDGTKIVTFYSYTEYEEPEEDDDDSILVSPEEPTFNTTTGVITIPDKEGVVYKIGDEVLDSGDQEPLEKDTPVTVTAEPDEGYTFGEETIDSWEFEWES